MLEKYSNRSRAGRSRTRGYRAGDLHTAEGRKIFRLLANSAKIFRADSSRRDHDLRRAGRPPDANRDRGYRAHRPLEQIIGNTWIKQNILTTGAAPAARFATA